MNKARDEVCSYLDAIAMKPRSQEDIYNVALVACNGLEYFASIVADAIQHVGPGGKVDFEPSNLPYVALMRAEGLSIPRGLPTNDFLSTRNLMKLELNNPEVLLLNFEINNILELLPLLDYIKQYQQDLLLVLKHLTDEPLSSILYNYSQNKTNIGVVTFPSMDEMDHTTPFLEDISAFTGAKVMHELDRMDILNNFQKYIGKGKKAILDQFETLIISTESNLPNIEARVAEAKEQLERTMTQNEAVIIQDRINRMQGKSSVILCGGNTKSDIQESRDIITDGLNSTKKAVEKGFVPGGGVALLRASTILDHFKGDSFEENLGIDIVKNAIRGPFTQILKNCSLNGKYIAHQLLQKESEDVYTGYDVKEEEFKNFLDAGILDSLETVKNAVIDSVGNASMLATTEVCVLNERIFKSLNC